MKEQIEKEISLSQEVFQSLPTNNIKNRKKFLTEIEKEIAHYQEQLNTIYQELENRQKPYIGLQEDQYPEYDDALLQLTKALQYTNNLSTAYEKLKLDKSIYHLNHYQASDLKENNKTLKRIVDVFKKAGIPLQSKDFTYTKFVTEYMESFFSYQYYLDSRDLEKVFENLYWKDPYLILEIELNIRHLYLKNQVKFEKYIKNLTRQLLTQFEKGEKNIIDDYAYLRHKLEQLQLENRNNLLYHFVNDDYHVEDYTEEKIHSLIKKYFISYQEGQNLDEIYENTLKLLHSLEEYRNYRICEPFIEKMKKLYHEPLEKNIISKHEKKIRELEKKLFKLNKKSTNSLKKTKVDELEPKINQVIQEIHEQYTEIDKVMFQYVLKEHIRDNSTIFKALLLLSQYYWFIADLCREQDANSDYETIDNNYQQLLSFVLNPDNTMINNITMVGDIDISDMVISNYQLLGVQITKDMLEDNNLTLCMEDLKKILIYHQLQKFDISISSLMDMKKIQKIMEANNSMSK